jgi:hypothetical protein
MMSGYVRFKYISIHDVIVYFFVTCLMDSYTPVQLRAHQLVQQFLRLYNYQETLEAFKNEAAEVLAECPPTVHGLEPLEELLKQIMSEEQSTSRKGQATSENVRQVLWYPSWMFKLLTHIRVDI